jgi:hypothetical protein
VVEGQTYYYVATSVDGSGQESVFSNEAQAYIPYATVTSQLAVNPSSIDFGSISVSSTGSRSVSLTNSGPADVRIFGNSVTGAGFAVSGLSSSFILPAGQSTSFTATFTPSTAGAASGSISVVSNASNSPTNLSLSGNGVSPSHSVDLTWTASTSQVNGYNIYRGGQSGGPYTKMNSTLISSTLYTDTTVQEAQTYFYVVTAVDASSHESAYSNEAKAVIPSSTGTQQLDVSPSSLSFGDVNVGSSSSKTVTLTNWPLVRPPRLMSPLPRPRAATPPAASPS